MIFSTSKRNCNEYEAQHCISLNLVFILEGVAVFSANHVQTGAVSGPGHPSVTAETVCDKVLEAIAPRASPSEKIEVFFSQH